MKYKRFIVFDQNIINMEGGEFRGYKKSFVVEHNAIEFAKNADDRNEDVSRVFDKSKGEFIFQYDVCPF